MGEISEADLALARVSVNEFLERLGVSAHLYAVDPREEFWAVIVECDTESGWQRIELQAGPELLAAIRGDAEAWDFLFEKWRPHFAGCDSN